MNNKENLKNLFNILHDGVIVSAEVEAGNFELKIGIQYLAELINKDFKFFFVKLIEVQNLNFQAWTDEPSIIINPKEIFNLEIEILSSEFDEKDNLIVHSRCFNANDNLFSGGKLVFKCKNFKIFDEKHKALSIEKLKELSTHYWNDIFGE